MGIDVLTQQGRGQPSNGGNTNTNSALGTLIHPRSSLTIKYGLAMTMTVTLLGFES